MNINLPQRYSDIDEDMVINVLDALDLPTDELNIERETRDGRYMIIEHESVKFFVGLSNDPLGGRNSFLMQYLPPVYQAYIFDESPVKSISIYYPYGFRPDRPVAPYHTFVNKLLRTAGIKLLNEGEAFNGNVTRPFENITDLILSRLTQSQNNQSNKPSYFENDEDAVTIYAKTYGANSMESFMMAIAAYQLTDKKIVYYPVVEQSSTQPPEHAARVLELLGIDVREPIAEILDQHEVRKIEKSTSRKSARFHYNLLVKFGKKECYMCGCDIESTIIGAHIHRVTDIDHEDLNFEEKVQHATSADNGLWLCATHDRMYEYGIVYYDDHYNIVIKDGLDSNQVEYINWLTLTKSFQEVHRNIATSGYLELHRQRVVA